jgi:hypothetical protein
MGKCPSYATVISPATLNREITPKYLPNKKQTYREMWSLMYYSNNNLF